MVRGWRYEILPSAVLTMEQDEQSLSPPSARTPMEYLSDTKKVIFSQLMTMIVEVSAADTKNVKWLLLQLLQAILVGIF